MANSNKLLHHIIKYVLHDRISDYLLKMTILVSQYDVTFPKCSRLEAPDLFITQVPHSTLNECSFHLIFESMRSVNIAGRTIPTKNVSTTEYSISLNTFTSTKSSALLLLELDSEWGSQLKIIVKHIIKKVTKNTYLFFGKIFQTEVSGWVSSAGVSSMLIFRAAVETIRMTKMTEAKKMAFRAIRERFFEEKQLFHNIVAEPVSPKTRTTDIFSLVENSLFSRFTWFSVKIMTNAIKLKAWKNIIESDRILKILQLFFSWLVNPFHDSTASATRIVTWQIHWQMKNILPLWRNGYFVLSLKQLNSIRRLKATAASSKSAWKMRKIRPMMRTRELSLYTQSCLTKLSDTNLLLHNYPLYFRCLVTHERLFNDRCFCIGKT